MTTTTTARSAALYYDTQDPASRGWAWKWEHATAGERSGPVDGDLPESADLADVLDAAGGDLPDGLDDPALWAPAADGNGWEMRR